MTSSFAFTWYRRAALSAALAGCGGGGEREAIPADAPARPDRPTTTFVDSLALTAPGGAEVWFTDGRVAQDSLGVACSERAMEIRTPRDTVPVPLLYTGEIPTLENDSTLRARVWLNCGAQALYLVNIQTGRPSLVEP
jgi:hypothetical protein